MHICLWYIHIYMYVSPLGNSPAKLGRLFGASAVFFFYENDCNSENFGSYGKKQIFGPKKTSTSPPQILGVFIFGKKRIFGQKTLYGQSKNVRFSIIPAGTRSSVIVGHFFDGPDGPTKFRWRRSKVLIIAKIAIPKQAGFFGALLAGWLVVVARGLYLARHLFKLYFIIHEVTG